jgi:hypothetical protein
MSLASQATKQAWTHGQTHTLWHWRARARTHWRAHTHSTHTHSYTHMHARAHTQMRTHRHIHTLSLISTHTFIPHIYIPQAPAGSSATTPSSWSPQKFTPRTWETGSSRERASSAWEPLRPCGWRGGRSLPGSRRARWAPRPVKRGLHLLLRPVQAASSCAPAPPATDWSSVCAQPSHPSTFPARLTQTPSFQPASAIL